MAIGQVKNMSIKAIEHKLGLTTIKVSEIIGEPKDTVYYQKKHKKERYLPMVLGIRLMQSNLTLDEILAVLKQAEKLKGDR